MKKLNSSWSEPIFLLQCGGKGVSFEGGWVSPFRSYFEERFSISIS